LQTCTHDKPIFLTTGRARLACFACSPKKTTGRERKPTRQTAHRCERCASEFLAGSSAAKFCSDACRTGAYNDAVSCRALRRHRAPRDCKHCGAQFCVIGNTHRSMRYCDARCASRAKKKAEAERRDPLGDLRAAVRSLIWKSFRGFDKSSRTHEILGCTWLEFKRHMERQFTAGMTWANRGQWHIDHIVPMSTAETAADVIRLNHFTNLRPLWARDNLLKGSRVVLLL
jgi:hypothetical protein